MTGHRVLGLLLISLSILTTGCTLGQSINDYLAYRQQLCEQERLAKEQERLAKVELGQAKIDSLEQARQIYEYDRIAARQQWEADREAASEALRDARQESIRSDFDLRLDQRMVLHQLQVDTKRLKEVLDFQEKQEALAAERRRELLLDRFEALKDSYMMGSQEALTLGNVQKAKELMAKYRKACDDYETCKSCDACDLCDCGMPGDEPLTDDNPVEPLRAVDIPFMIPVSLQVGVEGLNARRSRVIAQPLPEPLEDACDDGCETLPCAPPCKPDCDKKCWPFGQMESTETSLQAIQQRTSSTKVGQNLRMRYDDQALVQPASAESLAR